MPNMSPSRLLVLGSCGPPVLAAGPPEVSSWSSPPPRRSGGAAPPAPSSRGPEPPMSMSRRSPIRLPGSGMMVAAATWRKERMGERWREERM